MTVGRPAPLVLALAILLVGGTVIVRHLGTPGRPVVSTPASPPPSDRLTRQAGVAVPVAPMTAAPRRFARPAPASLSAAATDTLLDQVALRQLAHDRDLELTELQWNVVADIVGHYQSVRQAYEASIASVTPVAPGRYRVDVPPYADVGDALRAELMLELRETLGITTTAQLEERLGEPLEGYFAGFGVSAQRLEFVAQPGEQPNDFLVTRTATFWNSVQGREQLTTRREAHWPRLEDPTGRRWAPFLALLGASAAGS